MTDGETITLSIADGVATITLSRPARRQAFNDRMESELVDALEVCDDDSDVRAVVLTGVGDTFCAGMDLGSGADAFADWRASPTAPPGSTYDVPGEPLPVRRDGGGRVALRIYDSAVPVIAAVNGPAIGVGATLVLACDVRLASSDARFGFVFGRRGLPLESCSSWFLPRAVGLQTALEWTLTGRTVSADEALTAGLLRSVHEPGALLGSAHALAREIADHAAPTPTSVTRRLLWSMHAAPHPMHAHEAETRALNLLGVAPDAQEGIGSFLERRPPVFAPRDPAAVDHALGGPNGPAAWSDRPFRLPFEPTQESD
jgi:enoyl-CoA hydratase/carnithine racemase